MNIYVASPIQTYKTDLYKTMRRHIARLFPGDAHYFAEGLYVSSAHWRYSWPAHCRSMDVIVFFTDKQGYIGRGVRQEIDDMLACHKPAYLLLPDGTYYAYPSECTDGTTDGDNWRCYQQIAVEGRRNRA